MEERTICHSDGNNRIRDRLRKKNINFNRESKNAEKIESKNNSLKKLIKNKDNGRKNKMRDL